MKTKMNEATLMAYLYGELSAAEKSEVEKYFLENPEVLKEFQELQAVKSVLGKMEDKEVIAPPIFVDDTVGKSFDPAGAETFSLFGRRIFLPFGKRGSPFGSWVGIAASLLIVMLGAKLLGVQMKFSNNEFIVSFGESKKEMAAQSLSPAQVQQMINQSLSQNNDFVNASWSETQSKMADALKQNTLFNSQKVNEISKTAASNSQEEIRQFMQSLREENSQALQEYIRLSSTDQKQYIETLLVDFNKYMQEQRSQDLDLVQTRITSLEEDNNLFKQEAGQILTSLIGNDNSTVKRN